MPKPRNFITACFFCSSFLVASPAQGQVEEFHFYSEQSVDIITQLQDYHKLKDGLIVSGRNSRGASNEPVMVRIDTLGNVLWSMVNQNLPSLNCSSFKFQVFEDGFIYGVSPNLASYIPNTLWKVDVNTGAVVWRKNFYTPTSTDVRIAPYDSLSFLAAYSTTNRDYAARISTQTGDTLETYDAGYVTGKLAIAADSNKNVYLSVRDELYKFDKHDFSQIIWQKDYTSGNDPVGEIHEIYIDQRDSVFIYGREQAFLSHGKGVIKHINSSDGNEIWSAKPNFPEVKIADFVDENQKFYTTYRHTLVGGGYYMYRIAKIDKLTGVVDWEQSYNMTPLGQPGNHGTQAGLSLDIDDAGNVYTTGYYGDSNYGPKAWGVMKLAAIDGSKIYDLTITQDSANYDALSSGIGVCVINNTPIIVGNLEFAPTKVGAYWVKINKADGSVRQRNFIGSSYAYSSGTVDIESHGDSTYVLKQQGRRMIIEKYVKDSLEWQQVRGDITMLKAGQLKVSPEEVFVSYSRMDAMDTPPYYSDKTLRMGLFALSKSDGKVRGTISYTTNATGCFPTEIEADSNCAYLFTVERDSIYCRKWDRSSGQVTANALHQNHQLNLFEGHLDQVFEYDQNHFIIVGNSGLHLMDKNSLQVTQFLNAALPGYYYDQHRSGDTLFLSGQSSSNQPMVTAIDLGAKTTIWSKAYGSIGAFYRIDADKENNLYVGGDDEMQMCVYKLQSDNGSSKWHFYQDSTLYPASSLYEMTVNEDRKCLALGGSVVNSANSSHMLFTVLDFSGDTLLNHYPPNQLNRLGRVHTIEVIGDSSFWFGGAINSKEHPVNGYIFSAEATGTDSGVGLVEYHHKNIPTYPNPTNGVIHLDFADEGDFFYSLWDVSGREILAPTKGNSSQIVLPSVVDGIYLLHIERDGRFYSTRIVVKKGI